jgi:hypothetical protein
MRFGRASQNSDGREIGGSVKILGSAACPDPRGWICNVNVEHFRSADAQMLTLVKR